MRNRMIAMILVIAMTLSLTACGSSAKNETAFAGQDASAQTAEAGDTQAAKDKAAETDVTTTTDKQKEESHSKILVAYFTAAENTEADAVSSATPIVDSVGAVRFIADVIADKTGADQFSIRTVSKYAADFDTAADKAKAEGDEDARPNLETHIDNMDQYDTIFLGYCAWWYDMPMAVYSFLDEYDLSGKTIIPFAAHEGSRFAGGVEAIKNAEPDATVIADGYSVRGNEVSADIIPDIERWLGDLGY